MADNNHTRRVEFADNDPFAELTRIMGHDPRAKQPEAPVSDDLAFDIDLEKELMGELDFSDFDAEPAAAEPQGEALQPAAPQAPDDRAFVAGENTSADEAFAAYDAGAVDYDDDTQAFDGEGGALEAELGFHMEDAFAADNVTGDMERSDDAGDRADADYGDEAPPASFEAAPVRDTLPQDGYSAVEPDLSLDDDFSDDLHRDLSALDDVEETTASDASQTPLTAAVPDWTRSEDRPAPEASDEFDLADIDMELGALDDEAAAEPADMVFAPDAQSEPVAAASDWSDEPEASDAPEEGSDSEDEIVSYEAAPEIEPEAVEQPAAPAELTLEDELAALLSDEPSAPIAAAPVVAAAAAPAIAAPQQSEPSDEGWHPSVNTFGRANFQRSQVDETPKLLVENAMPEPEAAFSDGDFDLADDDFELAEDAQADAPEMTPAVAPVEAHTAEPASPESYAAPAPTPAPVSMLDEADFADIFGDDADFEATAFEAKVEETPAYASAPAYAPGSSAPHASQTAQTAPVDDVEKSARAGIEALASWRPEQSAAVAAAPVAAAVGMSAFSAAKSRAPEAPDVETVDVSEAAIAMQDDLDIPDLDYGTSDATSRLYDDLEGEIAQAFGDVSFDEPDPAASEPLPSAEWATPMTATATSATQSSGPAMPGETDYEQAAQAYPLGEGQWQTDDAFDDGFDYETDLEQAVSMAAYGEGEERKPQLRNRGLLIAAIVTGVAVVGGIGALGMSFMGGGSDSPAMVRADTEPMKVRPENPGGATVPNQNNEVYQRVGGGAATAPEQESLITTAEEPVDVNAQSEPALPPGIVGGGEATAALSDGEGADQPGGALAPAAGADPAGTKAEDRIVPTAEAEGVGASNDLVAVAPRRVRTMVVRPDGTMVPREEPAAAAAPAENVMSAEPIAAPSLAPAGSGPLDAPAVAGTDIVTPDSVGVVPSQRSETQVAAAPVRADPPAAQQPATPASAPAAAAPVAAQTSEWSMQIASQPTAEGAQATYQDLARRYGTVLQGRGVNIVRADIEGMGTYYRVRIPASNRDEAIQLCTRYKSAGGSCFVSR